ncbi:DUF4743 domain-containing protein [Elstera sp.]|jgi:8-oxo-dGTP pyrophosphatase MutT (NUDIX family)|uniref:NUDIX hydrolase n=1 Tax=Elstera sp. TaxID=1916664 RepID=UPI0037BE982F
MTRTLDPYLDHLSACNRWTPGDYVPFRIGHERYGAIRRDRLDRLMVEDDLLTVTPEWVELIAPPERLARSAALADLVRRLVASRDLAKERRELYPVLRRWGQEPVALVDRGAADYLGIRAYGVHLNVLSEGDMWIARRAKNKAIAPGKLDNLVAGGQPYGLTPLQNLIKECGEEASMSPALAAEAKPTGAILYRMDSAKGLRDHVLFSFDLTVPGDFKPVSGDGEHEAFYRWPMEYVDDLLRVDDVFKFNIPLVIIDYFLRTGRISSDAPGYEDLRLALAGGWRGKFDE